jgi:hypothetical protein
VPLHRASRHRARGGTASGASEGDAEREQPLQVREHAELLGDAGPAEVLARGDPGRPERDEHRHARRGGVHGQRDRGAPEEGSEQQGCGGGCDAAGHREPEVDLSVQGHRRPQRIHVEEEHPDEPEERLDQRQRDRELAGPP